MTKRLVSIAAIAAALALFVPLSVTTSAAQLKCRIPFSFVVNGKAMPPGFYTMSTRDSVLLVTGVQKAAVVLTNRVESRANQGVAAVFEKIGNHYELVEAWTGGGAGRQIVPARDRHRDSARAANTPVERVVIAGM